MQSAHYRPAVIESRRMVCCLSVALVLFTARAVVACDPCLYDYCATGCPLAALPPSDCTATPSTINLGESSVLSATPGDSSDYMSWYSGRCSEMSLWQGDGTSIVVSPSVTTNYYVSEINTYCESPTCCEVTVTVPGTYCDASSVLCDECISRVQVGNIDNATECFNYSDYSAISTPMVVGTAYPITVHSGTGYTWDQCGIWVDWNHDFDFSDDGEAIAVTGSPGAGPYTATITPPVGAVSGITRLRVRVAYFETVNPCDIIFVGEVEDYSIYVCLPADFDHDSDVGLDDFDVLDGCYSGPAVPHSGSQACQDADLDTDGDVDQSDFGVFQRCYSGEGNPADPNCAN